MKKDQPHSVNYFIDSEIIERFLVFEGIDGAGKSTQLQMLNNFFSKEKIPFWQTEEPTNGLIGQFLRQQMRQQDGSTQQDEQLRADLFAVDRAEHLYRDGGGPRHGGIIELCQQGLWCLCHRYLFSSIAYQGSNITTDSVWQRNKYFPLPSWIIFIKISPELISHRLQQRQQLDSYERASFLEKVQLNFERIFGQLANKPGIRLMIIDGEQQPEKIHQQLVREIQPQLPQMVVSNN